MKKHIILLLALFALWGSGCIFAQKELWGVNPGANDGDPNTLGSLGDITKFDINGTNPQIMHQFQFATGKTPLGKLFQASNGKLYGTTRTGGTVAASFLNGFGTLFEYDLIFNKYRVLEYFGYDAFNNIIGEPRNGVIEPIPGKLYGTAGGRAFSYDFNTETFTRLYPLIQGEITGELMTASDGNVYGTADYRGYNCPSSALLLPNNGTIFKINTTTNVVSTVYTFSCNLTDGSEPNGGLVEGLPGKLYGTAENYGGDSVTGVLNQDGTLFEYNFITNTFTKKYNFDYINLGSKPQIMIDGGNGKLYGVCLKGGYCLYQYPNGPLITVNGGTLFEYTPATNALIKLHDLGCYFGAQSAFITKISTGNFFGTRSTIFSFSGEPYSFNLNTNTSVSPTTFDGTAKNLIEICRKPSYKYLDIDTYDTCVDDVFSYDLVNTNANSYVWSHDGVLLPTQITAVLSFANIVNTDAGIYTCVMTNDCGTTTTMPLKITVGCLGTSKVEALENNITLYPNPAKDYFNIKINKNYNNLETSKIIITNLLGEVIQEETPKKPNALNFKIDTSKLQQGVYQAQIKTNLGSWSSKFVKE